MKKNKKISISTKIVKSVIIFTITLATGQQVYAAAYDPNEDYKELGVRFWEDQKPDVDFYINSSSKFLLNEFPQPEIENDWTIFSLSRGMYLGADYLNQISATYFSDYTKRIEQEIFTNKKFGASKLTDIDRLIFSLTPLNYNIKNVSANNTDFILKLSESFPRVKKQGINSPIWTLLAINAGDYQLLPAPEGNINWNTEAKMIDYILDREIEKGFVDGGGWALSDKKPDVDVTAMAIQSLAPYYLSEDKFNQTGIKESHNISHQELKKAVERGIAKLSSMQMPHGGFGSYGTANSESGVQVIVALTEMGINPKSNNVSLNTIGKQVSFVKNGAVRDGVKTNNMVDSLLTYWDNSSKNKDYATGFKHVTEGNDGGSGTGVSVNGMASDQATYGLIAYDRFMNKQATLQNLMDQKTTSYKSFKAKPVRLTYEINGQSNVKESFYLANTKLDSDTNKSTGKEFKYWNSKQNGKGTIYKAGEVLSLPKENITLYAQYDYKKYGLTLNTNDGKLTTDLPNSFTMEDTIILPDGKSISRNGFSFEGWYKTSDFKGNSFTEISKGTAENITLYAKWIETSYIKVIDSINDIGEVTLEKENDIKAARAAFESLNMDQKNRVTNLNVLVSAETRLNELINGATEEDKINAAVKVVETSINDIGEVTLESRESIAKARKNYDEIQLNQNRVNPALVQKLIESEQKLSSLQINEVEMAITKVESEITLAAKTDIEYARNLYNKLSENQQKLVKNYQDLETYESKLKKLEENSDEEERINALVKSVENTIDAIGEVTLEEASNTRISFARNAYDNLDDSLKSRVRNESVLQNKEAKYKELLNEREVKINKVEESISAIGVVTIDSYKEIEKSRSLYNELSAIEKPLVKNGEDLIKAETEYNTLKNIKKVEELIDGIGNISSENRDSIKRAEIEYNKLNNHKNKVSITHQTVLETHIVTLKLVEDIQEFAATTITSDSKSDIDSLNKRAKNISTHLSKKEKNQLIAFNKQVDAARLSDDDQLDKVSVQINALVLGDKSKESNVEKNVNHVNATKQARKEFNKIVSSYGKSSSEYGQLNLRLDKAEKSVAAIEAVIAKINLLPEISDLTQKDSSLVKEIETMFSKLSPVEKNEVTNKEILLSAQKQLDGNKNTDRSTPNRQNNGNRITSSGGGSSTNQGNKKKSLPKTGEVVQNNLVALGFAALGSLYFWKKTQEKE